MLSNGGEGELALEKVMMTTTAKVHDVRTIERSMEDSESTLSNTHLRPNSQHRRHFQRQSELFAEPSHLPTSTTVPNTQDTAINLQNISPAGGPTIM